MSGWGAGVTASVSKVVVKAEPVSVAGQVYGDGRESGDQWVEWICWEPSVWIYEEARLLGRIGQLLLFSTDRDTDEKRQRTNLRWQVRKTTQGKGFFFSFVAVPFLSPIHECLFSHINIQRVTRLGARGDRDTPGRSPSMCTVVGSAGQAGERPDRVSPSRCLIIDPSGIVFSIVSIMMALVLLSTLASRHA